MVTFKIKFSPGPEVNHKIPTEFLGYKSLNKPPPINEILVS